MVSTYLLWSAQLGGWLTKSATYHSDPKQAERFDRTTAFDYCRRHIHAGSLGMIPVLSSDVEELLQ